MTIIEIINAVYINKSVATKAFNKINEELYLADGGHHEPSANELKVLAAHSDKLKAYIAAQ
jgi:hypothetical protein